MPKAPLKEIPTNSLPPIGRAPFGAVLSRHSASNGNPLMTDFLIADHGSIVSILPVSAAACEWLDANIIVELWQWTGS